MDKKKVVMVFGVFDILHNGHRHFLREAKKLGRLVAVVAPDTAVRTLKGRLPHYPLAERILHLRRELPNDTVVAGDEVSGSWSTLALHRPDIIALGYDQETLGEALAPVLKKAASPIELVFVEPYADTSLHSHALRKKL